MQERWTCYFWDFLEKKIFVIDPMSMGMELAKVQVLYENVVHKLHSTIFACVDTFSTGWHVDSNGWETCYMLNLTKRSRA